MNNFDHCFLLPLHSARWMGAVGFAASVLTPVYAADSAPTSQAASALLGSYTLIEGEKNGEKIPTERLKGSTARITEHTITTFDKDQQETYAVTYKLDTSKTPWRILMTSTRAPVTGEVAQGLIEQDGDTVKLIYTARGGEVPNDFNSENKQLMFVLKKNS